MEGRPRRCGSQTSPDRSRVWTEPSPKHQMARCQGIRVPVVYYLCKSRHLEHPHFIEVPVLSPGGLYLKDVINRLVVLRGKRMPSLYSWSCKRGYKNGFVWQDLSEDDLILPAHGNEYVLKGSEILDQTPPDRLHDSSNNLRLQNHGAPQQFQSLSSRTLEASSSHSSPVNTVRERKSSSPPSQEDDSHIPLNLSSSPERGIPNFEECRAFMLSGGVHDASTQTEDRSGEGKTQEPKIQTASVSTANDLCNKNKQKPDSPSNDAIKNEISPSRTPSSASSGVKIDTLESLIRAEVNKFNSFRIVEEEEVVTMKAKVKRTNPLLQLLTCGSTLVKGHHSLGFIPTYKPQFLNMRLGTIFPSSMTLRELDYMSEGSRVMRLPIEQRDSFSRNVPENYLMYKEDRVEVSPGFNSTFFYNGDMSYRSPDLKGIKKKVADLTGSNSPSNQTMSSKPILNETFRAPILDARSSSSQPSTSFNASKRVADIRESSTRAESTEEETERTIKIEERLTSGARIIIQSKVPPDYEEKS